MAESNEISCKNQLDVERTRKTPEKSGAREGVCTPPLPRRCRPLAHQVAGHRYGQGKTKKGMLQHEDGTLLKPLQPPPRGQKELGFYQKIFDENTTNQDLLTLRLFMPKYLGKFVPEDDPSQVFIKLEDITRKFHQPCILDVKVGRRCYDLEATPDKIEREKKKYPPIDIVGFQLMGMRIYKRKTGEVVYYDKKYGRSLDENHVGMGLTKYLTMDGTCQLQVGVLQAILCQLEKIKRFIKTQSQICLFSSSLLIVYEGEPENSTEKSNSAEHSAEYSTENTVTIASGDISFDQIHHLSHSKGDKNGAGQEGLRESVSDPKLRQVPFQNDYRSTQKAVKEKNVNGPHTQVSGVEGMGKTESTEQAITGHSGSPRDRDADRLPEVEDGLSCPTRDIDTDCIAQAKIDVRMIDFAHVFPSDHIDENYLYGIKNLISYLEKIGI
ncbi:PREDICTED: inositol polyphosphate multikinase-like [Branchiostoma belcheri]|uniref:Kinase n=1 Tax=Branchiostoma belcheri TaxID=7741 RepID=A0A6P5A2L9_BRABE|nr:PREDICTED: inositol polyphosphate multikinase-like [Branchiostoma belcheri]